MKKVERDAKGIGFWIWASTYGKDRRYELPKNYCNYFWSSAWAYLIAVFSWPGHLINLIGKDTDVKAGWWSLHVFVTIFLYKVGHPKAHGMSWEVYFVGLLTGLAVVAGIVVIVLIVMGLDFLIKKAKSAADERRRKNQPHIIEEPKEYKENGIVTWFKAFKGKYCPQIEWKNKPE